MNGEVTESDGQLVVPPAYAVVLDHLRREIHLGSYAPGDKLPPERVLAPRLGVSRVTLREAIRALEAEGYVATRRGASGGVTVQGQALSPTELRARIRDQWDEIVALFEFRRVNERLAAERASIRIDAKEREALTETDETLRASVDLGSFRQADSAFHLQIARAADSDLLRESIEEARARLFLTIDALDYQVALRSTLRGHEQITAALRAGDAAAAGRAMARHISKALQELETVLKAD